MSYENSNFPSPPSYIYATTQPMNSSTNPNLFDESSQISLDSNRTESSSRLIDDDNDQSFGSACLDVCQCFTGFAEFLCCCCLFVECLTQCK
jgi:hypothetical protein